MSPDPNPTRRRLMLLAATGAASIAAPIVRARVAPAPLQIVGQWEIGGLAPAKSGHVFTRMQIAETLVDADDDGRALPGLAQGWSVSADAKVWRFTLRPSARFHDGTQVKAAAVVRCLQAARIAPAMLSAAPVDSIDAEGDAAIVIRMKVPYAGLPALLAHSSTLILAPSSYGPKGEVRAIIASGPYRVTSLNAPQRLEAGIFDGYDGIKPALDQVRYLAAGRAETRALMAESGQADLAYGLDPASLTRLRKRSQTKIESVTLPRTVILKINAGLPALRDLRVRQALSLCIDRIGIARALLREPELAATQLFAPTLRDWHDPDLLALRYDPSAALNLLRDAGWRRGSDGLRNADGMPLNLTLRTFPDRPELPIIATALQEQWRQAGIAVQVSIGNSGDIALGHRDGSLQLGLAARNYGIIPDPTATLQQDFAAAGGEWGAMGWSNPILLSALAELSGAALDMQRSTQLRRQVASILQAELPVIPITWYRQQVAVNQRLDGVSLDPLERSYRLTRIRWRV